MNRFVTWRPTPWEGTLFVLIFCAAGWSAHLSPYYLSLDQILESTRQFIIPGLLALGLMVVVVTAEIDISLASILAVGAVVFARLSAGGIGLAGAIPIVVLICVFLGAFNGFLVARLGLPSLAVTLGTMGAYRGLAFIVGSEAGYTNFSDTYQSPGSDYVLGIIPISLIVFAVVALLMWFLLQKTVFGRRCFAVGRNKDAAWIAGINVRALKITAYAIAGGLAAIAALIWIGQYGSARGDNADGAILFVVTAVVLGGVDINGGRGSVLGVVLALLLLGTLRNGMGLANIGGPVQTVVLGALLTIGVLRPVALRGAQTLRGTLNARRHEREKLAENVNNKTPAQWREKTGENNL